LAKCIISGINVAWAILKSQCPTRTLYQVTAESTFWEFKVAGTKDAHKTSWAFPRSRALSRSARTCVQ